MIKTLIAAVLLAAPCFGQSVFRVQKFCEVGGQKAVTQGLNSVTNIQRSFPKCTVTVYLTGTTTIAAIFSDNLGPPTPLANPFTANVDGSWGFYASTASCYDVVTSGGNPGDTFPSPFTYSNICVGGGGGGTGVNPGTPYQVTRYDPTGVNIQDSTGSDNPANGPTRWVQGLSVEGNAGYRMFVNSSAGTTTNLLVCRDTSVTSITEVTTCPVSSNSVFGLADNGSGATGNVRVAMIGFHSCVFDGQTVVGDWAIPSATNAGQCSDAGASKPTTQQVLGHVTTLNTGAATLATVDLWTGDTISGGGATVAIAPCTITGCFAYYTTPNSIGGDNHTNLDGFGNGQLGSLGLTDATHSGFWYETAGPTPPPAPTSSTLFFVDSTIATPNSFKLPKAAGAADIGKAWGVTSNTTDTNGNPVDIMGIISAGSSTEVQVNGVDTTAQTPINFQNTSTVTFTNPSAGVIQAATVAAANQASNPSAPTLTPNTPGSTAYSYAVVGCEDVNCAFHSAMSA
jgi:hypothetical protein